MSLASAQKTKVRRHHLGMTSIMYLRTNTIIDRQKTGKEQMSRVLYIVSFPRTRQRFPGELSVMLPVSQCKYAVDYKRMIGGYTSYS